MIRFINLNHVRMELPACPTKRASPGNPGDCPAPEDSGLTGFHKNCLNRYI